MQARARAEAFAVPNELGQLLQSAGGAGLNASTSHDATRFYVSLPVNALELWFALESERMQARQLSSQSWVGVRLQWGHSRAVTCTMARPVVRSQLIDLSGSAKARGQMGQALRRRPCSGSCTARRRSWQRSGARVSTTAPWAPSWRALPRCCCNACCAAPLRMHPPAALMLRHRWPLPTNTPARS